MSEDNEDLAWGSMVFLLGFVLAFGAACLLWLIPACGAVYTNTTKVETNWYGGVSRVEGGSTTQKGLGLGGLPDILDSAWSILWLVVIGSLVLWWLLRKFPALRSVVTLQRLRVKKVP